MPMKLPVDCPFAKMPLQQFLETETHRFDCCRAKENVYLLGTDEPRLCQARQTEVEAYRFIWKSSFDGHALVHIAREGKTIGLRWKKRFVAPAPSMALLLADWERLQRILTISDFWLLNTDHGRLG
jgi:hypothetical protein